MTTRTCLFLSVLLISMTCNVRLHEAQANSPVVVQPGDNIQILVDNNPEGTTFLIEPGIHRLHQITPKNGNTFIGKSGAILNGSKLLKTFTKEGNYWVAFNQTQQGRVHGLCAKQPDGTRMEGCNFSEDFFIDDKPLFQVAGLADVEPGKWFFDYEQNKIFFADDPDGKKIETSVASYAFMGSVHDVIIRDVIIEKYASPAQHGAIHAMDQSRGQLSINWKIENSEVRLNHGIGIKVGHRMKVINSHIHHNGQLGIGGTGNDVFIENNEIAFNNTQGFSPEWEAGGGKFINTQRLTVRENHVHDNKGPGLWTDRNNIHSLFERNKILNNDNAGIFHLASDSAIIRNNLLEGNGFGFSVWLWGAGILIHSSKDVEVYGNTLSNNADGIAGMQQSQRDGRELENLFVHHNHITMTSGQSGLVQDVNDISYFTSRNNRFEDNIYVLGDNRKFFLWNNVHSTWTDWQRSGQDTNGILSVVEVTVPTNNPSILIQVGEDIQRLVDTHPEKTSFLIKTGIHRFQQITPKNGNVFIGEPGAILSGAKLLTVFDKSGQYWMVENQDQEGKARGRCQKRDQGVPVQECKFPEDFFINDVPLLQVEKLAKVEPGKWFFDYAQDRIYFADNPTGKKIETSVTPNAFQGSAENVTIKNLIIEKYANSSQDGAIHGKNGTHGKHSFNWQIENSEIRLTHGLGIRTGDSMRVIGNNLHHNGQLGIGGSGDNILVQNNEIAYNNTAGFSWDFEAGGAKFVRTKNLVVRGNFSHHNFGCGLWTDLDNVNTLYEGNRVIENTRCGIFHELSHSATIKNNIAERNGAQFPLWLWGGGIVVYSSDNVEVFNNIVADNAAAGIAGIEQDRSNAQGQALLKNLYVHDNLITLSKLAGVVTDRGTDKVFTSQNNRFANNSYILGDRVRPFVWKRQFLSESEWQTFGHDTNGTFTRTK